jgi:uncharacterized protein with NAD-binding domain and iron-sulfur cluster
VTVPVVSRAKRVAILGGGIAGLAAAWELSRPEHRDEIATVTVYERSWRLGGKGASSRGVHGRIEEHGLHVWLGYYENAFRLMRECYAELDRAHTDPHAPILDWDDAFVPSSRIGLGEQTADDWMPWVAQFTEDAARPGEPGGTGSPASVPDVARRALSLLRDFARSLPLRDVASTRPRRGLVLSTEPTPPGPEPSVVPAVSQAVDAIALAGLVGALESVSAVRAGSPAVGAGLAEFVEAALDPVIVRLQRAIAGAVHDDATARRVWQLLDLVAATLRGVVADGLLVDPDGFAAIDGHDYREWIAHHGAAPDTLESPLVRGVYDLVFGYEDGRDDRPRFAAGTGLLLSAKLFFDYQGAIFWKMTAGMGEVVFAPLYQALVRRGVQFRFFHRVDDLRLSPDGLAIESVVLGVSARTPNGVPYEPLVDVGGLQCWPARPRDELLADRIDSAESCESIWSADADADAASVVLQRGTDFDAVVLAIPVGMHRHICRALVENPATPRWRTMTDRLGTVATQAMQLWLTVDDREVGVAAPGVTISGYPGRFHTHASMTHLLPVEQWPSDLPPQSILYFCHTLRTDGVPERDGLADPERELSRVRDGAIDFLSHDLGTRLPGLLDEGGFRWDRLWDDDGRSGSARLASHYLRANVDPSSRYVLSLPGTGAARLRADESGYDNLFLAGDWIDSGLNAGCIEAAVMSGVEAANAVRGRPLLDGVIGFYVSHAGRAGRPWTVPAPA